MADYVGMPHGAAVNSGRRGMSLIFEHLGIGEGDEVIVPAYTLGDLLPLVEQHGAKAVPADIDRHTLNVTPESIGRRISPRTKAVLALHAFGMPCPIEAIQSICERKGLPLIEDCAHSLGATVGERQTGSFGYAGFYSFEATKPVSTFGGGLVVSRDKALIDRIHGCTAEDAEDLSSVEKKAKSTRTEQRLFDTGLAFPFLFLLAMPQLKGLMNKVYRSTFHAPPATIRYAPLQAHLGLGKLPDLAQRIERRNGHAALYRDLLDSRIRMQPIGGETRSTWYFLVATVPGDAVRIRRRLLLRGVDAGTREEIADDCAALLGYDDCPAVAEVYARAVNLPMYDGLEEHDIHRVAAAINALIG